ncbi:E3 ubiquitin-protein ligase EL5-like [Triticum dicoccoides]|uniref:E3 ubiquitin-protein ligase EL5-like n=1 Tax=Triticum dicoccoides TaxID=85692 RepID=UPI00188EBB46|nr:E3 ubiquitin-protein ligase EL5-like [Triticum dicoccoides]XP_037458062.1 E3 ubiquitin-protein ligase EL5-like [Triticum dicoccoides]XP_037470569.1 E3 ubiquitin-protein ligase EL5-like [Triticum dicoccoides]
MDMAEDLPQVEEGLPDVLVAYVAVHGPLIRQSTLDYLLELGTAVNAADIAALVGVAGDVDPVLAAAVDKALKTVDALSDDDGLNSPICLEDDIAAWKLTPCGHRFHGRCVERWLHAKGSCPMCRHQVVTIPAADDESYVYISLSTEHGQDVSDSGAMEIDAAS